MQISNKIKTKSNRWGWDVSTFKIQQNYRQHIQKRERETGGDKISKSAHFFD